MGGGTLLVIRHAEKPDPEGSDAGIDEQGNEDEHSLTPRGWQRAGCWAELFVPSLAAAASLPVPGAILASRPWSALGDQAGTAAGASRSKRPVETVSPLANKLGLSIDQRFSKSEEAALGQALSAVEGVVLVCWQHEAIGTIARSVGPVSGPLPAVWPGDRFDVVLRFDRASASEPWRFTQVVPVTVAGDKDTALQ
jgi:hypothetical protein